MIRAQRPFVVALLLASWALGFGIPHALRDAGRAPSGQTYYWQQPVTGDWQVASNWLPARMEPAPDDVLIFNSGGTSILTNVPTQTIGQLVVIAGSQVELQAAGHANLTIVGGDGGDLRVAPLSSLSFSGDNAIEVNLEPGTTGVVEGSVVFFSPTVAGHRLTAQDSEAITFKSGAVFTAGNGFVGNPFGVKHLKSILFDDGSTYLCMAGGDPFGAVQPDAVVVFRKGSRFSLQGDVQPSFAGRKYADFEVDYPSGNFIALGSSALVIDNLTLLAGNLSLNMTGDPGHSITGNISLAQGTLLDFSPLSPGTVHLNGSTTQIMSGPGGQGAGSRSTIAVDNQAGVILKDILFLPWNLKLVNGVLDATDPFLFVGVGGTVTRTHGYIHGSLIRNIPNPGPLIFDVGTKTGYSPVEVDITGSISFPTAFEVRAYDGPQPNISDPSMALSRYWYLFEQQEGTRANLTFHYLDPIDIPASANELDFVIQRYNGSIFAQSFGTIDTVANTFQVNSVTDFARDWTLAEPGAVNGPTPTPTPTPTLTPTPTPTPSPSPAADALFDYDGDGRADMSVFRPSSGVWYLNESTDGIVAIQFGADGDKLTPADYDGDGKTDIAIYRPSTGIWYILNSSNGTVSYPVFGVAEDIPAPGDYDGDGKADLTVFRPSQGTWYRTNSSNGTTFGMQFGANGDMPTVGDFDGDGKNDLGIFRPSVGDWYNIRSSNGSVFGERFGQTGDRIAPADYDGDGKTDIAIYRPSTGLWVVRKSATATYSYEVFGLPADVPISGDYDGDGKADIGVWRPSDGTWYIKRSDNSQFIVFPWGQNGDKPTPAAYGN